MRRLHKTIEAIGWTRNVPRLEQGDSVARAFDAMSKEAHDCVLVVDRLRTPSESAARPGEAGTCDRLRTPSESAAHPGEAGTCDRNTVLGIFTSRDFLNRVAATRRDPGKLTLAEVMTPTPRTLRPRDGVAYAINWMAVEGFRNVPIVDDAGEVLGVLTVWDVMRHLDEVFDEIEATPRHVPPKSEISEVINMVDLGGGG